MIKKTIFSTNVKTFILANDYTRQRFADEVNASLDKIKEEFEKIGSTISFPFYNSNSVWTWDSRGTLPKDGITLVAIARVINKPLDLLFLKEYTYQELVKSVESYYIVSNEDFCCTKKQHKWNIDILKNLTAEERDLIYSLAIMFEYENGNYYSYFDAIVNYEQGKNVTITFCFDSADLFYNKSFTWEWAEYGEEIKKYKNEMLFLEDLLKKHWFEKFKTLGLLDSIECFKSDEQISNYFVCRVKFLINRGDLFHLLNSAVSDAEKELIKYYTKGEKDV